MLFTAVWYDRSSYTPLCQTSSRSWPPELIIRRGQLAPVLCRLLCSFPPHFLVFLVHCIQAWNITNQKFNEIIIYWKFVKKVTFCTVFSISAFTSFLVEKKKWKDDGILNMSECWSLEIFTIFSHNCFNWKFIKTYQSLLYFRNTL